MFENTAKHIKEFIEASERFLGLVEEVQDAEELETEEECCD